MEKGNVKTSFCTFIEAFHLFGGTDRDAAVLFGNHESKQTYVATDHDDSDAHRARLRQFTRTEYKTWFMDTNDNVRELTVKFREIINNTYVAGDGDLDTGLSYDCKLLSPNNSEYTFLYFSCNSGLIDKALFVIPYIQQVKHKFKRGLGLMFSISVETPRSPEIKLFIMMKSSLPKPDEAFIRKHLRIRSFAISDYLLRYPTLLEKNKNFVSEIKGSHVK